MISPNLSDNGPRLPPNYYHKSPPSPDTVEKTERVAAMNKITNFSIAAIMNSRNRRDPAENDEDEFEAKRRKLAEAVPALGKNLFFEKFTFYFLNILKFAILKKLELILSKLVL